MLFAFERFDHRLAGRAEVEDITAGNKRTASGVVQTEAMHTYLIRPAPASAAGAGAQGGGR